MGAVMKRRDFILGLGGAVLCSNAARGQQTPPTAQHSTTKKRIAQVVTAMKVADMQSDPYIRVIFDELKRLGYVEGDNLIVERYSGEGRIERYESLAHEVVDTKPDLILSTGAALPGGNITGVSVDAGGPGIWSKRLEIFAEAVPKLVNVVYISTRANWNSVLGKATQEAAQKLGISLVNAFLNSPLTEAEYRRVFDSIQRDQVDGIMFSAEFEHYANRFCWLNWSSKSAFPRCMTNRFMWRPEG